MSTQAKAVGYLDLNITGFDQALKTAKNLMVGFAATFGAYKLGNFFKDGVKDAIDFGKEMQSAGRAMGGFDPGKLLLVQKALEKAGMGADEARGHIGDFIKEGRDVSELFGGADNYAKALKSAAADYGSQASILTRSGAALQTVWNTMESISSKIMTFFLSMTEQFVGPLQGALDYLDQIDLAEVGADFGKGIATAAETLYGLFKNGDMMTALKLGVSIAFQEGVNYLVGGIEYAAGHLGPLIVKGFSAGVTFLKNAFEWFYNNNVLQDSMIAGALKFTATLLNGFNTVFRVMQAGIQYAVQSAIEAIPGASKLLGVGGDQHESFGDLYDQTKDPVSEEYTKAMSDAGGFLTDKIGGSFKKFIDGAGMTNEGAFKKGDVFNTSDDMAKLEGLLSKGFQTGTKDAESASAGTNSKSPAGVLTQFTGSSSKVIADNLAKVGGGGGYLRVGQTLAEKTLQQQLQATKQNGKALDAIKENTKDIKPKPAVIGQ